MIGRRTSRRSVWLATLLALADMARAQDANRTAPSATAPSVLGQPAVPPPAGEVPAGQAPLVTTLDTVQALRPEEEVLDLYTFKNPVTVDPNRFDKAYDPGITPEQMALQYGGYVNYGINMGLLQTWKGIKKITRMRPYEQPAIARPPPLDQAQMRRAVEASAPDQ